MSTGLPGLPAKAVERWLNSALPGVDLDRWSPSIISGGLSNITYRITLTGGDYILRRPPLGHVLP